MYIYVYIFGYRYRYWTWCVGKPNKCEPTKKMMHFYLKNVYLLVKGLVDVLFEHRPIITV